MLTLLRTDGGKALPVVRGWLPGTPTARRPPPRRPARSPSPARSRRPRLRAPTVSARRAGCPAGQLGMISAASLVNLVPYDVYDAWVTLEPKARRRDEAGARRPRPQGTGLDLKAFQNLGYTGEWFVFAGFVVFMWFRLLRREAESARDASWGCVPGRRLRARGTRHRSTPPRRTRDPAGPPAGSRDRDAASPPTARAVPVAGSRRVEHARAVDRARAGVGDRRLRGRRARLRRVASPRRCRPPCRRPRGASWVPCRCPRVGARPAGARARRAVRPTASGSGEAPAVGQVSVGTQANLTSYAVAGFSSSEPDLLRGVGQPGRRVARGVLDHADLGGVGRAQRLEAHGAGAADRAVGGGDVGDAEGAVHRAVGVRAPAASPRRRRAGSASQTGEVAAARAGRVGRRRPCRAVRAPCRARSSGGAAVAPPVCPVPSVVAGGAAVRPSPAVRRRLVLARLPPCACSPCAGDGRGWRVDAAGVRDVDEGGDGGADAAAPRPPRRRPPAACGPAGRVPRGADGRGCRRRARGPRRPRAAAGAVPASSEPSPSGLRVVRPVLRLFPAAVVHSSVPSPVVSSCPSGRPYSLGTPLLVVPAHAGASMATRSAAMPREPYAFTEPSDMPSVSATWASVMSAK